jgi:cell division septation protein DedD
VPQQPVRRLNDRTKVDKVVYIELPSGNGGIVKDVSEGGLGFCAVAPLEGSASIPVLIRLPGAGGSKRIPATGDLVWTDGTRKSGGLRFADLPEESRQQIRAWRSELDGRTEPTEPSVEPPSVASRGGPASLPKPRVVATAAPKPAEDYARRPVRPSSAAFEKTADKRRRTMLMVACVSMLAGVIGFESNNWYSEIRGHLSSKSERQQPTAAGIPPPALAAGKASAVAFASSVTAREQTPDRTPGLTLAGSSLRVDGAEPGEPQMAIHAAPAGREGAFLFVQVGAYSKGADAQNLLERLRRQSFIGYSEQLGKSNLYRVQLGPYTTDEAADMAQDALQKAGFDSWVRESASSN